MHCFVYFLRKSFLLTYYNRFIYLTMSFGGSHLEFKKKNNKYYNLGIIIQKFNGNIVETDKIDTHSAHVHDRSLSWLGKNSLIKSSRVSRLVICVQTSLSSIMGSCKCFGHITDHIQFRVETINDLQNITLKTKDRATGIPLKTGGELRCSRKVSSSCSTCGTHLPLSYSTRN
jgi:hypothetical protein